MMKLTRTLVASACALTTLIGVAGCGESNAGGGSSSGQTVIKIQTFNNFGYGKATSERPGADLWAQYEKEHPNVKIEETVAGSSDDARTAFNTAIASGSSAYDIYAADFAWMGSILAMPDSFVDLSSYTKDNDWLDWKRQGGTAANGKLVGAGSDIGPVAVCYRTDLFEKAGLPTDRDEVAKLLGGEDSTWETYFKVGREYTQKTGLPWYDAMPGLWNTMKAQSEETYVKKDGTISATDAAMKKKYDTLAATTDISAHLKQWSDDWSASFKVDNGFATMTCPAWMTSNIKGNSGADFTKWDVADVTPGGAASQGGSYLVVPESSPVKEEAAKLTAWLTAPEQQVAIFKATSNYPSSQKALSDPAIEEKSDPALNNAPVGKIFANRARGIKMTTFTGGQYFDIDAKFNSTLQRVDVTKEQSAADSWKQFEDEVKSLS